jgi:hypothetical protein
VQQCPTQSPARIAGPRRFLCAALASRLAPLHNQGDEQQRGFPADGALARRRSVHLKGLAARRAARERIAVVPAAGHPGVTQLPIRAAAGQQRAEFLAFALRAPRSR